VDRQTHVSAWAARKIGPSAERQGCKNWPADALTRFAEFLYLVVFVEFLHA
jgi:hypothetical protein